MMVFIYFNDKLDSVKPATIYEEAIITYFYF